MIYHDLLVKYVFDILKKLIFNDKFIKYYKNVFILYKTNISMKNISLYILKICDFYFLF
jgi:hypothetical protein